MYRICIFAKAPVAGQVKTRLAPLLGLDGAAALARTMLEQSCLEAQAVPGVKVELCTSPEPDDRSWCGLIPRGLATVPQGEGDLGVRLSRAARRVTDEGDWPVLIGADCPSLDRERLAVACQKLGAHDAFIHPAQDGGYALLALSRYSPFLFSQIVWSGPDVAAQTIERLCKLGWRYSVGEVLRDIDEPSDYEAHLRASNCGC